MLEFHAWQIKVRIFLFALNFWEIDFLWIVNGVNGINGASVSNEFRYSCVKYEEFFNFLCANCCFKRIFT